MRLNGNSPQLDPAVEGHEAHSDPEVAPAPLVKAKRRRLTPSYKLRVLEETESLSEGELGAYLRKNGLYWSSLATWRRQRNSGALSKTQSLPRGRKKSEPDLVNQELVTLRKQVDGLEEKLRRANLILEVQKKVLSLCADVADEGKSSRSSCSKR
jgi:transposase